jgi:hypothetical protein
MIIAGDTLLGIALLYGVEVDDLLAANPGIDPGFLTIGAPVVIPLGEGGLTSAPTPEPLPVKLLPPVCYASAAGDITCFSMVANGLAGGIEGVTVQLSLVDEAGNIIIDQLASPPLNLIPAHSQLPAVTTFGGPLPDPVFAAGTLVTAFPLAEGSSRYIPVNGGDPQITISENGMTAHVEGRLRLPAGSRAAGQIRAAGIAYDELDNPVGYRIWEANQVLDPGGSLQYAFDLYSLGPPITRVEVFFEGRPIQADATPPAP